ncbi:hypothetical protein FA13DRAFT_1726013 [Coprinellus micaceus]|uniref:Uncharacterized protein n=1 Tax=Coprinellus micaceus TaxID=71717 RepID=A0A4Y7TWM7_COPMI|nr:hypothetical protein FA13DRAFT_1726013 [Coprinellus micaceus]
MKGDKTGHFSEENWGDYKKVVEKNGVSERVHVRRATVFAATIDAELDEECWKIIINAAKNLVPNSLDAADGADEATESEEEAVIIRDARFKRQTQAAPATPETPATGVQASSSSSLPLSSTA